MKNNNVYLHKIVTTVPEQYYTQDFILDFMLQQVGDSNEKKTLLKKLYNATEIYKRHVVLPVEYAMMNPEPTTAQRNDIFIKESKRLAIKAVRELFNSISNFDKKKITHIITVSCTGFLAPGIDFYLARDLELDPSVQRFNLGFMGCHAAFPALKLARNICLSEPDARVLIVNVELCTLHFQRSEEIDIVVSNAIFADGVSAALVSAHKDDTKGSKFILHNFASSYAPQSEEDMMWKIGEHGFLMKLSKYIPSIVKNNILLLMEELFKKTGVTKDEIDIWAIHPGGKAILEKVQEGLNLTPEDLDASYHIMHEHGNMSSTTIMFVFEHILSNPEKKGLLFSAGFGPGLTIESSLMEKIDS